VVERGKISRAIEVEADLYSGIVIVTRILQSSKVV
jgi:hypothetical protein